MIGTIITAARLALAITSAYGPDVERKDIPRTVSPRRAFAGSLAIVAVAGSDIRPELLASIAIRESGMDRAVINPRSGACGVGQVLYSRRPEVQSRRCAPLLRDELASYRAAADRYRAWRSTCARLGQRGELCALAGYVSGVAAARERRHVTARSIQRRADRLRRSMEPATTAGGKAES